ncbi:hypothetical protein B0H14DRAFT_2592196 [Mycena olivaceomarginata]|nr:hypothetical protein B0H14DRAFT_2592196 [Mycena olivaceomarginata]
MKKERTRKNWEAFKRRNRGRKGWNASVHSEKGGHSAKFLYQKHVKVKLYPERQRQMETHSEMRESQLSGSQLDETKEGGRRDSLAQAVIVTAFPKVGHSTGERVPFPHGESFEASLGLRIDVGWGSGPPWREISSNGDHNGVLEVQMQWAEDMVDKPNGKGGNGPRSRQSNLHAGVSATELEGRRERGEKREVMWTREERRAREWMWRATRENRTFGANAGLGRESVRTRSGTIQCQSIRLYAVPVEIRAPEAAIQQERGEWGSGGGSKCVVGVGSQPYFARRVGGWIRSTGPCGRRGTGRVALFWNGWGLSYEARLHGARPRKRVARGGRMAELVPGGGHFQGRESARHSKSGGGGRRQDGEGMCQCALGALRDDAQSGSTFREYYWEIGNRRVRPHTHGSARLRGKSTMNGERRRDGAWREEKAEMSEARNREGGAVCVLEHDSATSALGAPGSQREGGWCGLVQGWSVICTFCTPPSTSDADVATCSQRLKSAMPLDIHPARWVLRVYPHILFLLYLSGRARRLTERTATGSSSIHNPATRYTLALSLPLGSADSVCTSRSTADPAALAARLRNKLSCTTAGARNARITSAGSPRVYSESVGRMCPRSFPPIPIPIPSPFAASLHTFPSLPSSLPNYILDYFPISAVTRSCHFLSPRPVPYRYSLPTYHPIVPLSHRANARGRSVYPGALPVQTRARAALLCDPGSARRMSGIRYTRSAHRFATHQAHTSPPHPALVFRPALPDLECLRRSTTFEDRTQAELYAPHALRDSPRFMRPRFARQFPSRQVNNGAFCLTPPARPCVSDPPTLRVITANHTANHRLRLHTYSRLKPGPTSAGSTIYCRKVMISNPTFLAVSSGLRFGQDIVEDILSVLCAHYHVVPSFAPFASPYWCIFWHAMGDQYLSGLFLQLIQTSLRKFVPIQISPTYLLLEECKPTRAYDTYLDTLV